MSRLMRRLRRVRPAWWTYIGGCIVVDAGATYIFLGNVLGPVLLVAGFCLQAGSVLILWHFAKVQA